MGLVQKPSEYASMEYNKITPEKANFLTQMFVFSFIPIILSLIILGFAHIKKTERLYIPSLLISLIVICPGLIIFISLFFVPNETIRLSVIASEHIYAIIGFYVLFNVLNVGLYFLVLAKKRKITISKSNGKENESSKMTNIIKIDLPDDNTDKPLLERFAGATVKILIITVPILYILIAQIWLLIVYRITNEDIPVSLLFKGAKLVIILETLKISYQNLILLTKTNLFEDLKRIKQMAFKKIG